MPMLVRFKFVSLTVVLFLQSQKLTIPDYLSVMILMHLLLHYLFVSTSMQSHPIFFVFEQCLG